MEVGFPGNGGGWMKTTIPANANWDVISVWDYIYTEDQVHFQRNTRCDEGLLTFHNIRMSPGICVFPRNEFSFNQIMYCLSLIST